MGVDRRGPVVAHEEQERSLELAPGLEQRPHLADHVIHFPQRPAHGLGIGMGLMGIPVHRGELREHEPRGPVHRAEQVARDRIVRGLVPPGVVRQRAPELALAAGRIACGRESPRDRGEDPEALRHQLEDGAYPGGDVVVEPRRLVSAVAPYRLTVAPPPAGVGPPVEPADRRDVAAARRAPGEKREIGHAGGRGKNGGGPRPPAGAEHRREVGQLALGQARFGDIRTESVDQQEQAACRGGRHGPKVTGAG